MGSSARPGLAGSSFNGPSGFAGLRPWLSHQGSPSRVREQAAAGQGFGSTTGVVRPPRPCSLAAVGQGRGGGPAAAAVTGAPSVCSGHLRGRTLRKEITTHGSPSLLLLFSTHLGSPCGSHQRPPQGPLPPRAGPQAQTGGEGSARGPGEGVHPRAEGALSCQHPKNGNSQTITAITGLPVSLYSSDTWRMPPQTLGGGSGLEVLPGPCRDGHSLGGKPSCLEAGEEPEGQCTGRAPARPTEQQQHSLLCSARNK